jgi:hypothetical protein
MQQLNNRRRRRRNRRQKTNMLITQPNKQKTCQKHNTCKRLSKQGVNHCAAVIPLLHYKRNINAWVFGVGLENGGKYAGKYNLCAGKGESNDNINGHFCWLKCAKRELKEELKINARFKDGSFDRLFRGSNKRIRVIIHGKTPVFIAMLPSGTSRSPIKNAMKSDCSNHQLPHSYKEMSDFEYFRLDNGVQIEGKNIMLSSFASAVRTKIDVNKL